MDPNSPMADAQDFQFPESENQHTHKTLDTTNFAQAQSSVSDITAFGDGDLFQCLSKASSKSEGWMKSTKAMEIPDVGCVVQVTTQQGDNVAEALTFVPGVWIQEDEATGCRYLARGSRPLDEVDN